MRHHTLAKKTFLTAVLAIFATAALAAPDDVIDYGAGDPAVYRVGFVTVPMRPGVGLHGLGYMPKIFVAYTGLTEKQEELVRDAVIAAVTMAGYPGGSPNDGARQRRCVEKHATKNLPNQTAWDFFQRSNMLLRTSKSVVVKVIGTNLGDVVLGTAQLGPDNHDTQGDNDIMSRDGWFRRGSGGESEHETSRFTITLNNQLLGEPGPLATPMSTAATVYHEMLHQMGYRHDRCAEGETDSACDERVYQGAFVTVGGQCIRTSGAGVGVTLYGNKIYFH